MAEKSTLWLLSAGLIATGAAFYTAAVTLYWRPCAGTMLDGSVLRGYRYESDFSEDCLLAMDQAPGFHLPEPGAGWTLIGSLGAVAATLLAAAWLVLLPALPVRRKTKLIAALPGVLGLVMLVPEIVRSLSDAATPEPLGQVIAVLVDLSLPVVVLTLYQAGVKGMLLVRTAIVAVAATATGLLHQFTEYVAATVLSDANWDTPPGSGYLTAALLLLTAIATLTLWWQTSSPTRAWRPSTG